MWQPMSTAPRDGTAIQAEIPGYGSDFVIAFVDGYLDKAECSCCGWTIIEDQEPPPCWTDGVCWAENEDGKPSVQPSRWKPLDQ